MEHNTAICASSSEAHFNFLGFGRAGFKKSFKFVRIVQAEDLKRNEACADRHLKFERLDESKRAISECLVWFFDGESRLFVCLLMRQNSPSIEAGIMQG